MEIQSSDKAQEAFKFLKNEIPHCEDMLKYLDEEDSVQQTPLRQSMDQGEIDISVLTFKLGKTKPGQNNTSKNGGQIYHTFDTDSYHDRVFGKSSGYSSQRELRHNSSKPAFKKVSQVKCFDIAEVEENDSSFHSTEHNVSQQNFNEIDEVSRRNVSKTDYKVKSPIYIRKSQAEKLAKNIILN